jgi:hypothetical protein
VLQQNLAAAGTEFKFMRISELIHERELRGFSPDWREQLTRLGVDAQ